MKYKFNDLRVLLLALLIICLTACASNIQLHDELIIQYANAPSADHGDYNEVRSLYINGDFDSAAEGATHLIATGSSLSAFGAVEFFWNLDTRIKSNAMINPQESINDLSLWLSNNSGPTYQNAYLSLLYTYVDMPEQARTYLESAETDTDDLFEINSGGYDYFTNVKTLASLYFAVANFALFNFETASSYFDISESLLEAETCPLFEGPVCGEIERSKIINYPYVNAFRLASNMLFQDGNPGGAKELLENLQAQDFEFYQEGYFEEEERNLYDHFLVASMINAIDAYEQNFRGNIAQATGPLFDNGEYQRALEILGSLYLVSPDQEIIEGIALILERYENDQPTEGARRFLAQANIYIEEQDYDAAIEAYRQFISLSPWVTGAFYNLALIYETVEDYQNAITTMNHFITLSPESNLVRDAQDQIYEWEVRAGL